MMYKLKYQNQVNEGTPKLRVADDVFEKMFLKSVDTCLTQVLGETCTQTTYQLLEEQFGLSKQQIPQTIGLFTAAIEKIFGIGATLLEITFMKHLAKNVDTSFIFTPTPDNFSFNEYVKALKAHLESAPIIPLSS